MNTYCCPEGRWVADSTPSHTLYAPNLEEMKKAPLADLFWGTIEYAAVADALARADAMLRHLELRRRVLAKQTERLMVEMEMSVAQAA
jgi:hypothetical protein